MCQAVPPPGVSSVCPGLSRECNRGRETFWLSTAVKNPNLEALGVFGAGTPRTAVRDAGLRRLDRDVEPRVAPEIFRGRELGFMKLFSGVSSLTPTCRKSSLLLLKNKWVFHVF